MIRKLIWLLISCLMILSLVVASCGPAAEEEQVEVGKKDMVQLSLKKLDGTTVTTSVEKPEYGGTLITAMTSDYSGFDPTLMQAIRVGHMQFTSNELIQGDWIRGPQGTGETMWEFGFLGDIRLMVGELCESWETPNDETIIYNIREGVKFHNKPPANGREVIAEDVAWNIRMQFNYPAVWQSIAYPPDNPAEVADRMLPGSPLRPTSVKALDKYTVEVKVPAESQGIMLLEIGDNMYTSPPEVWEGTGPGEGEGMASWDQVVGSGPYVLTDYISGSSVTFKKHPDYFEYDPLHPKNKIPYIDEVIVLIITDASTRLTALRTGKVDILAGAMGALLRDDAKLLMEQYPDLEWSRKITPPRYAAGRNDTAPFDDIRVRRALNMAVNKKEILDDYLQGEGVMVGYPYHPTKDYEAIYTPLEEMPAEVQELYTYNPDKAKELLAEAGFPNGFKTHIICQSQYADEVSMLREYLLKVGVDMEIRAVEQSVYNTYYWGHTHEQMLYGTAKGCWAPFEMLMTKPGMGENFQILDDPYFLNVQEVVARDIIRDPANYRKTVKEAAVYELSTAWGIFTPAEWTYSFYWPWVKAYHGITWHGWANFNDIWKWVWIDEDLKKSMGY